LNLSRLDEIKKHWEDNIAKHGARPDSSWSDIHAIQLEISAILNYLKNGDLVLDVGCNNGFSTLQYARERSITLFGFDYISTMVDVAKQSLEKAALAAGSHVNFEVGNALDIEKQDDTFDKVIATRVMINLETWENQQKALNECVRVLKPGGLLLLSEAFLRGWKNINRFRQEWGLSEIPMPTFNHYLDEDNLLAHMSRQTNLAAQLDFSSTYYVGTRVLKPLLMKALDLNAPALLQADSEWNHWISKLPSWGNYGVQKLFVFQKKQR